MQIKFGVDQYLHPSLISPILTRWRAINVIISGCITAVLLILYGFVFSLSNNYAAISILLAATLALIIAALLLKRSESLRTSRLIVICTAYISLIYITFQHGNLFASSAYWLPLIPAMGLFMGGSRMGIYWGLITVTTIILFHLYFHALDIPPYIHTPLIQVISILGLLLTIFTLVFFFELEKTKNLYDLTKALSINKGKSLALLKANLELKALTSKLNAILAASADGIVTANTRGEILTANRSVGSIFGYDVAELIGKSIYILLENFQNKKLLYHEITDSSTIYVVSGVRQKGTQFPLEIFISKVAIMGEDIAIYIMRDISERQDSEKRLASLVHYDQLTGLSNRVLFEIQLLAAIKRAAQNSTQVALLYLDLDNFKNINNSFGHDVGDLFLKEAAERFKYCIRKNDILARASGDEFSFILENITNNKEIEVVAHKILKSLQEPFSIRGYSVMLGASIGIASFPANGSDALTLIKNADIAMYHAKSHGKNNFQYFDESLNKFILSQLILENELQGALRNNEFFIMYQPQYEVADNNIVGVEALIRWNSPILGLLKPTLFIPTAEKMGIITNIGEWVLKESCTQFKKWLDQNLIPAGAKIAINLSAIQLQQSNFLQHILDILQEVNINPNYVELELTESMIMDETKDTLKMLKRLDKMGITIAIDDFGTGYSSLSRLKNFPVRVLKIDKSFLYNLTKNIENASIVKSVIALAHGLELKVIAEGVETREQLEFLKENNCDYVQGFYYNPPLDTISLTDLLKRKKHLITT